jgi:membrane associated rhomboid family serine protease
VTTPLPSSGRPSRNPFAARSERKQQQRAELAGTSLIKSIRPSTAAGAGILMLAALAVLWIILGVDALFGDRLLRFGIKPRQLGGVEGIVVSPFLHANLAHLTANTVPFAVLGWLVLMGGLRYFVAVTAAVVLVAGGIDWGLGPSNSVIVGVSGVIFGWLGYLLARAWFSRSIKSIAVAVAVLAVFSSMFSGLLPRLGGNVFWGGHVAGFVVGVAVAAVLHRKPRPSPNVGLASPR